MEIERAIIESLTEPRNYTSLFLEAYKLRRERNLGLSKEDFNNALRRLVDEKIVIRESINKREKKFSLNLESIGQQGKNLLSILGEEDAKIDKIQALTKEIENEINYLSKNKISHRKKHVRKVLELITNILLILLGRQKLTVFLLDTSWSFPFTRREIKFQQQKCQKLIKRLSFAAEKLDKQGSATILLTIFRKIQNEIDDFVDQANLTAKYFQNKH